MPEVTIRLKKICTHGKPEDLTNKDLPLGNAIVIPKRGIYTILDTMCTVEGKEVVDILFFCYAESKGFLSILGGNLYYPFSEKNNAGVLIKMYGELDEVSLDIVEDSMKGGSVIPSELKKGLFFQTDDQYWMTAEDVIAKSLVLVNLSTGAIIRGGDLRGFLEQKHALLATVTLKGREAVPCRD